MHSLTILLCALVHLATGARKPLKPGPDTQQTQGLETGSEKETDALLETETQTRAAHPERWICYGFRTSGTSPNMIDSTRPMFDFKFAHKVSEEHLDGKEYETDSVLETANKVATASEVNVSYMAFSAAAKVSTDMMNNEKVKKYRLDRREIAYKYTLTLTDPYPHRMLTATARNFLQQEGPERIVEAYGEFFAEKLRLGGVFQLTNVAEMSSSDSKSTVAWDVKAKYTAGFSIGASSQGTVKNDEYRKNSRTSTRWVVQGGDVSLWFNLRQDDSNKEDIRKLWAKSLSDNNLYPVWKRLIPIWKLLEDIDSNKARQLETYLRAKWESEGRDIVEGQPRPDLRLYCVGHDSHKHYSYISQSGRGVPSWAGSNRFCFQTFHRNQGPSGASTYCQGRNDNYYSHLVQGTHLSSWAWRDHFCFDAYPDGKAPAGMGLVCNGWDNRHYYSYLGWGRNSVPSWAGKGRFCFGAYVESY